MNLCAILTQLQPSQGKQPSNESEKAHPNKEARAYERARQQNAREEFSRWKGKGKDILPKDPTPSKSERPAYLPAMSSCPPPPDKALPPHVSWRQALLDSRALFPPPPDKALPPNIRSSSELAAPHAQLDVRSLFLPPPDKALPPNIRSWSELAAPQAQLDARASRPPPPNKALPPSIRSWADKYARKAQAQEKVTIQEHRRLVQEASKVKMFNCVICMDSYIMDFSAPIRSCGHVLCRDCMKEHVQSQVAQSIWPIRCPTCVADHSRTEDHGGQHRSAPSLR